MRRAMEITAGIGGLCWTGILGGYAINGLVHIDETFKGERIHVEGLPIADFTSTSKEGFNTAELLLGAATNIAIAGSLLVTSIDSITGSE